VLASDVEGLDPDGQDHDLAVRYIWLRASGTWAAATTIQEPVDVIYGGCVTLKSRAAVIICIDLLWALNLGILALALPLYITSLGGSATQWGLLSGAFGFGMIFAEPIWGWVSDKIGIAVPFVISRFASTLLLPIYALTGNMGMLLVIQIARAVIEVAIGPLSRKALAYSFGSDRKGTGIGLFQACLGVGIGIGPLLGGYVIGRWGYSQAFTLCSGLSFLSFLMVVINRANLSSTGKSPDSPPISVRLKAPKIANVAQDDSSYLTFFVLALIAIPLFVGIGVTKAFVPLLGSSVLSLPPSQVALLLAISGMVSGILMICMGKVSDRLGRRPLIVGGLSLLSISLFGYGFSSGFVNMAIVTLINSIGMSAAVPAAVALVSDITPSSRQGQMIGLYGSCEDLGLMVGSLLCGFIWDVHSPRLAFVVCSLITGIGIVLGSIALNSNPARSEAA